MTRFNITISEGVEMVIWALDNALGGEVFVPKIPSYRIIDVASAIGPRCKREIVGIRPGEKIHEEMITSSDSYTTIDLGKYFAILSSDGSTRKEYIKHRKTFETVADGYSYNSGNNAEFLSVEQIQKLIKENVNENFAPI